MNSITTFTHNQHFRLFTCKPSANKPGGTYRLEKKKEKITPVQQLLARGCYIPPHSRAGEELYRSLSKSHRRYSAANRYRSQPCLHCHFMMTEQPKNTLNSAAAPPTSKPISPLINVQ
ncbi:hypothetical protein CEXT_560231 [Caerostris extrusa]|uniref:Uncharacterized protein n=1 Tax=Caerostris extrusa TaxID=172846 RepID=A0AAV4MKZ5_CAEEX|nr:hypothetical protein CEXT_560231 [Caerostris extrusa]